MVFIGFISQSTAGQELQKLEVNGAEITYLTKGQGDPIVFVHGGQEDYRIFLPQLEAMSGDYMAVTLSRRYNYPNDNPLTPDYNPASQAEDLKGLIEAIGGPVHLVGHSYGGLISMQFATTYPDMVKTLTLSEPAVLDWLKALPDCPMGFEEVEQTLVKETAEAFQKKDTTLVMKELFEFFVGADIQEQVPPEILTFLKQNLREMEAIVVSPGSLDAPGPETLASFDKPILLLTGSKTMPWMHCMNDKLVASLPDAEHHHLEASHEMWVIHPQELAQILSEFLEKNAE